MIGLLDHVMNVNHDLQPELNQGPADLQSAALTTGLCTLVQSSILMSLLTIDMYSTYEAGTNKRQRDEVCADDHGNSFP